MAAHTARLATFRGLLDPHSAPLIINLMEFRERCFHGIPDEPGIRAMAWKLLLGYLPENKALWAERLRERRETYEDFVRDIVATPGSGPICARGEDEEILGQIHRDARRTFPSIQLFGSAVQESELCPLTSSRGKVRVEEMKPELVVMKRASLALNGRRQRSDNVNSGLRIYASTVSTQHARVKANSVSGGGGSKGSSDGAALSQLLETYGKEREGSVPLLAPKARRASTIKISKVRLIGDKAKATGTTIAPERVPTPQLKSLRRDLWLRVRHLVPNSAETDAAATPLDDRPHLHWEVLQRILFVYARLNPVLGYVQGMNHLLAPIYYLFATQTDGRERAYAEADAFFCFSYLMGTIRGMYQEEMDNDHGEVGRDGGIKARLLALEERLARRDPELGRNLLDKGLHAQFYAFRWYTCLCVLEWPLPDLMRVWDSLLSRDVGPRTAGTVSKESYLEDFCCAMLMCVRDELIEGGFEENLQLLQEYPVGDVGLVLGKAATEVKRTREEQGVVGSRYRGWTFAGIKQMALNHSRLLM